MVRRGSRNEMRNTHGSSWWPTWRRRCCLFYLPLKAASVWVRLNRLLSHSHLSAATYIASGHQAGALPRYRPRTHLPDCLDFPTIRNRNTTAAVSHTCGLGFTHLVRQRGLPLTARKHRQPVFDKTKKGRNRVWFIHSLGWLTSGTEIPRTRFSFTATSNPTLRP